MDESLRTSNIPVMDVDTPTSRAVYQAREQVRQLVHRGVYAPGTRLPGERELAATTKVSRSTLRLALEHLEDEGVLDRQPQRGWFVTRRALIGDRSSSLQSFSDIVRRKGFTPTAVVLSHEVRGASMEEASRLEIAPASTVIDLRRLRGMDGNPICIDRSLLIEARTPQLAGADLADSSLYETLEHECGIVIGHASCELQAAAADPEVARLLRIAEGAPVLHYRDVSRDQNEEIVMSSELHYRGDAYRFESDLYRRVPAEL